MVGVWWAWLAALALYGAFRLWYDNLRGPLTKSEIDVFMVEAARMKINEYSDPAVLLAFLQVAAQARAIDVTVTVSTQVLDMARPESADAMLTDVLARHGRATILINNAGVALGGTFEQVAEADFDWLMSVNFSAVVRLTRTFLHLLRHAPAAQIVNLSSIFGIIAPPGQTAYCAAKFAVRGFSESLRHELETGGSTVGVTVVHPGGIRTGIAANARLPKGASPVELKAHQDLARRALRLSPEAAAARILRGIEQREPRVMVGKDAVAAAWIQRLFPVSYWKWVARGLARQGIRVP